MKELTTEYRNLIRQNVRCKGTITNNYKGISIKLTTKDFITKDEFLISFLNGFRTTYDAFADQYNQKEFRKFLKNEMLVKEQELEELKFAYKICGRQILEDD